ncbi:MAG: Lpg1974 family pore-forming outer membrane protein, partial [Simkaniaceae bacterium]|nr:Lpg1974 family pore-forming outer membrane protein [Simkaniaceae bacterium]
MKLLILLLCLSLNLFASKAASTDPRFEQVGIENVRGTYGANTAPALKQSVDSFFVWGEALYWTPKITGAGYAASHNGTSVDYPGNEKTKLIDFNWDWGMRIGAGYHTNFDAWDLAAEFTYFKFNDATSYTAPAGSIVLPVYVYDDIIASNPLIEFSTQASATYHIDYKTLSGGLSRDFFVSKKVALTPAFGLKGAWINHTQTNAYTGGIRADGGIGSDTVNSTIITDTKGVGPLFTLGTGWFLSNNWSFFGNFGLAL